MLETADLVAPDRVYTLYRQIIDESVSLETVCVNPWTFPNPSRQTPQARSPVD